MYSLHSNCSNLLREILIAEYILFLKHDLLTRPKKLKVQLTLKYDFLKILIIPLCLELQTGCALILTVPNIDIGLFCR